MSIEKLAEPYIAAGFSEDLAYAKAYRDAQAKGFKPGVDGVWKLNERTLVPFDDKTSKMPLVYDAAALSYIREDQTPRFLGALTHPEIHPTRRFKFSDLVAIQNRVDSSKVTDLSGKKSTGPAGIVGRFGGRNHILDGHHRTVARWLAGDADVEMHFIDLEPVSNAMKSKKSDSFTIEGEIRKIDSDKRLVWGWASVIEKGGKPVVDYHDDIIDEEDLVKAAHEFMSEHRHGKSMHEGGQVAEYVESMVFTHDVQKALGIDLGMVGWFVGAKVTDDNVWKRIKSGELKMFSIGGTANRIDNA